MKKIICLVITAFVVACALSALPVIAVIDFDPGNYLTEDEAAVMTDAFRNEMVKSGKADVTTRSHLEALKSEIRFQMSDWVDSAKVKQAGRMLGADYMVFGHFGYMGGNGNLQVEMVDVETSRVVYSSRMILAAWREFDLKAGAFAKEFINRIPVENIFTGAWTADVLHDDIIDTYTITFSGSNRCFVRVTSLINGREIAEENHGTYSFDGDILKITAVFRNSRIPHISNIQWSSVISIDEGSFNMLVKPTTVSASQVRATFTKE